MRVYARESDERQRSRKIRRFERLNDHFKLKFEKIGKFRIIFR